MHWTCKFSQHLSACSIFVNNQVIPTKTMFIQKFQNCDFRWGFISSLPNLFGIKSFVVVVSKSTETMQLQKQNYISSQVYFSLVPLQCPITRSIPVKTSNLISYKA
jgi:adenine-specific DNA methylase